MATKWSATALATGALTKEEEVIGEIRNISVDLLEPNPNQPRQHFDDKTLSELAASISSVGILEPLIVRETEEEGFQIVIGERRWRAAKSIGLKQVPCLVKELSNQESFELALIENVQRDDLSPVEEAIAFRRMIEQYGYSYRALGEKIHKSKDYVFLRLRLLELPQVIQERVSTRVDRNRWTITEGHARHLLRLPTDEQKLRLFEETVLKGLTTRQLQEKVERILTRAESQRLPSSVLFRTAKAQVKTSPNGFVINLFQIRTREDLIAALDEIRGKADGGAFGIE